MKAIMALSGMSPTPPSCLQPPDKLVTELEDHMAKYEQGEQKHLMLGSIFFSIVGNSTSVLVTQFRLNICACTPILSIPMMNQGVWFYLS